MLATAPSVVEDERASAGSSDSDPEATRGFRALDSRSCEIGDSVPALVPPGRLSSSRSASWNSYERCVRTVSALSIHLDVDECALSVGACHRKPFDTINLFGSLHTEAGQDWTGVERVVRD